MDQLISHRFRGFAEIENTIEGMKAALDFGVKFIEFDIRVARCGTPMIYHDEYAHDAKGQKRLLSELMAADFGKSGGQFIHMPTAEAMFDAIAKHDNQAVTLLIDIKDLGFEIEIYSLVQALGLRDRSVFVSWIPEVLYRIHVIDPKMNVCLSHWCQNPSSAIRAVHEVSDADSGHIPRVSNPYIHGKRLGWFVDGPLKGDLLDILKSVGGSVCVPQDMITRELSDYYHGHGIEVSTFSYLDWPHINQHKKRFNLDLYFIDNKDVFDQVSGS